MIASASLMFLLVSYAPDQTAADSDFDHFGGLKSIRFDATGFFRTQFDNNRWWLVTPEGHAFLSAGVCCVHSYGDVERGTGRRPYQSNVLAKHGTVDQWVRVTGARLRTWGFNTLGSWSSEEVPNVPRVITLNFAGGYRSSDGGLPDVFGKEFAQHAAKVARDQRHRRDDPYLIGYFLDNELDWAPHDRRPPPVFERYLGMHEALHGKRKLIRFFRDRYKTVAAFREVWKSAIRNFSDLGKIQELKPLNRKEAAKDREAFTYLVASRYFQVATRSLRSADPNHLILGARFVSWLVPRAFVRACGEYCDVVSVNFYEVGPLATSVFKVMKPETAFDLFLPGDARMPTDARFAAYNERTGKPILISEFGFRADDSGMPNTFPPPTLAQPTVKTQRERAERFAKYVRMWIGSPYCVGYHWFKYQDQPNGGRSSDGENGNYGLVNIHDEPYTSFVQSIREINRNVWSLHLGKDATR